jgi:hypothetical protein
MPNLCIIPFRALEDGTMTPAQLRVLCAIGAHTDREGAGVWASARTLADEARCDRSTFFRAASYLEAQGYVERTARWSDTDGHQLTSMYRVLLDAPKCDGGVAQLCDGGGRTAMRPKRPHERPLPTSAPSAKRASGGRKVSAEEQAILRECYEAYPARPEPHHWMPYQWALLALLRSGVPARRLLSAAQQYAVECARENTASRYVRTLVRFYSDGHWQAYAVVRVHGRTREEWARSGQDVAEFDRLADAIETTTTTTEVSV